MRPIAITGTGILGAAALAALAFGPSSPAPALPCPGTSSPVAVEVTQSWPSEVLLDNSKDRRELKSMATNAHSSDGVVHGLTVISGSHTIEIVLDLVQHPGGLCSTADKVTVHLQAPKAISYVERRYRPDSCPYRETAAHEARHAANYHQRQLEAASSIAMVLRVKVPALVAPKMAGGADEARLWWKDKVAEIVADEVAGMRERIRLGDLEVDSEASKGGTFGACADW